MTGTRSADADAGGDPHRRHTRQWRDTGRPAREPGRYGRSGVGCSRRRHRRQHEGDAGQCRRGSHSHGEDQLAQVVERAQQQGGQREPRGDAAANCDGQAQARTIERAVVARAAEARAEMTHARRGRSQGSPLRAGKLAHDLDERPRHVAPVHLRRDGVERAVERPGRPARPARSRAPRGVRGDAGRPTCCGRRGTRARTRPRASGGGRPAPPAARRRPRRARRRDRTDARHGGPAGRRRLAEGGVRLRRPRARAARPPGRASGPPGRRGGESRLPGSPRFAPTGTPQVGRSTSAADAGRLRSRACASSRSPATAHSSSRRRRFTPRCRDASSWCRSTPASTTTASSRPSSTRSSGWPSPRSASASARGPTPSRRPPSSSASSRRSARREPDGVVVYGDTNSTLAAALAASKEQVPVAHVEAGLRSFDRLMPEEVNRVVADTLSALLLCPSQHAVDNLRREGITRGVELVGDVMVDVARLIAPAAAARSSLPGVARARARRLPAGHVPPTVEHGAAEPRADRRRALRPRRARRAAAAPSHARGTPGGRPARTRRARAPCAAGPRLWRLHGAPARRAAVPDRLGWRAEGGVPAGGPLRHAA